MRNQLLGLLGLLSVFLIGSTPAAAQSSYQSRVLAPLPVAERDPRFAPQFQAATVASATPAMATAPKAVVSDVVGQALAASVDDVTTPAAELRDGRFHPQFTGAPLGIRAQTRMARPKVLMGLYGSLAAVHVFDLVSTRAALSRGAVEVNPTMRGGMGQQVAIKMAMSLGTVAIAERLWKKNKVAAIATMVAANGALAMISANNVRNARQLSR